MGCKAGVCLTQWVQEFWANGPRGWSSFPDRREEPLDFHQWCARRYKRFRQVEIAIRLRILRPNAKKAPGASTRTSLHGSEEPPDTFSAVCPEGLPTAVSSPKAWTCGRALAGVPASPRPRRSVSWLPVRRPAYPKIRAPLPGCRFPRRFPGCRPRRPKPPGRSAFDPVPRVRFSGSSASRPKASTASATCFLAVTSRVNE